jgi:prevent-host-death family protein
MQVGIRELRADVAAVVRQAAAGEHVVVTVGGRPTARLVPLEPGAGGPTLDDLVATGAVLPPRRPDRPAPPAPLDVPVDARTDRALREIR